jgi:hypothetical protein
MSKIKKFEGCLSTEDYIRGLLQSSSTATLGDVWEQSVTCANCLFAEKCVEASDLLEAEGKFTTCGELIDFLLGDLKAENIPVRK